MTAPSSGDQVRFLVQIQQLLAEGLFTATYKFALLLALADLSVELGDDSGEPLRIPVERIAEKFIGYYWRQSVPYVSQGGGTTKVLQQNTYRQAEILMLLEQSRRRHGTKVAVLRETPTRWVQVKSAVASVIKRMPLWKLQTLRGRTVEFLYPNRELAEGAIELRPGVAYCFRRFHGLIEDLVQGAWLRFVRTLPANQPVLGQTADLAEFLFGSERASLAEYAVVLREVDGDECFYCHRPTMGPVDVDHFIPWSRYPVNLGHNFVLAHKVCNGSKGDLLAGVPHLHRWWERAETKGKLLASAFESKLLVNDVFASRQITQWAYENAVAVRCRWTSENAGI